MDTDLAIASRRDERRYAATAIPGEVVDRILDAGRLAGSSRNGQPWTFVVPSGPERIEQLAATVFVPENVTSAGLVVALVVRGGGSATFDAGRAAQNMLLAAWNEGLASCPNGVADQETARALLIAADEERVAIVLSFGVPEKPRNPEARSVSEWSDRANRRPLEELVRSLP
jgi:nitroreductase